MITQEAPVLSAALNRLVWLDMEMTGLKPEQDRIIEVAMIVTDGQLNIVEESEVFVVHQSDAILAGMDQWNTSVHGKSGLIDRVKNAVMDEAQVEAALLDFMKQHVASGTTPMCGSTICQDRRFMARWMPQLEAYFHYRNLDVSSIKELVKRWRPDLLKLMTKDSRHQALLDIRESIEELRFYRTHFFRWQLEAPASVSTDSSVSQ